MCHKCMESRGQPWVSDFAFHKVSYSPLCVVRELAHMPPGLPLS